MGSQIAKFPKDKFLELIRSGHTEPRALAQIEFPLATYTLLLLKDAEFKEGVAEAKRDRADVFYEKIVDSVDNPLEKEEVPAAKLRIDTLKYLAAIDNPDKYSEKVKHQHDVSLTIFQEIKDLPASEARRIISQSDPFIVEAECKPIKQMDLSEEEELEELL